MLGTQVIFLLFVMFRLIYKGVPFLELFQYSSTGYGYDAGTGSPRLALQRDTLGFIRATLPIRAAVCNGTSLKSRNSQTCPARFRISELGNQVQILRLTNYSHWYSCLRWFMAVCVCVWGGGQGGGGVKYSQMFNR